MPHLKPHEIGRRHQRLHKRIHERRLAALKDAVAGVNLHVPAEQVDAGGNFPRELAAQRQAHVARRQVHEKEKEGRKHAGNAVEVDIVDRIDQKADQRPVREQVGGDDGRNAELGGRRAEARVKVAGREREHDDRRPPNGGHKDGVDQLVPLRAATGPRQ